MVTRSLLHWFEPIDRKLIREIWGMKGQVLAIAIVIASGVAAYVLSVSTSQALKTSQHQFYTDYRFADVYANFKRAPTSIVSRVKAIDGINQVETRVVANTRLTLKGFSDSVTAQLVSLGMNGDISLNQVYLRQGRLPNPNSSDEAVLSDAFAKAHHLQLGTEMEILINGGPSKVTARTVPPNPGWIPSCTSGSPSVRSYPSATTR